MPVAGVLAQAGVGDQHQVGRRATDGAQRLLHDPVVRPRLGAELVLLSGQPEQQQGGHARVGHRARLVGDAVDRPVVDAGHRRDLLAYVDAGHHEQRIDQLVDAQPRLADHASHAARAAQAARAQLGKAGARGGTGGEHVYLRRCRTVSADARSARVGRWSSLLAIRSASSSIASRSFGSRLGSRAKVRRSSSRQTSSPCWRNATIAGAERANPQPGVDRGRGLGCTRLDPRGLRLSFAHVHRTEPLQVVQIDQADPVEPARQRVHVARHGDVEHDQRASGAFCQCRGEHAGVEDRPTGRPCRKPPGPPTGGAPATPRSSRPGPEARNRRPAARRSPASG